MVGIHLVAQLWVATMARYPDWHLPGLAALVERSKLLELYSFPIREPFLAADRIYTVRSGAH